MSRSGDIPVPGKRRDGWTAADPTRHGHPENSKGWSGLNYRLAQRVYNRRAIDSVDSRIHPLGRTYPPRQAGYRKD
jgi:hypothetical protein